MKETFCNRIAVNLWILFFLITAGAQEKSNINGLLVQKNEVYQIRDGDDMVVKEWLNPKTFEVDRENGILLVEAMVFNDFSMRDELFFCVFDFESLKNRNTKPKFLIRNENALLAFNGWKGGGIFQLAFEYDGRPVSLGGIDVDPKKEKLQKRGADYELWIFSLSESPNGGKLHRLLWEQ